MAGLVVVSAVLALLLSGVAAGPAAVRNSAGAVTHEASRFIDWVLVHWSCPQPVDYAPIASCNSS